MTPLSILIVDDEEDICRLIVTWLEQAGHRVSSAANGREAGRLVQQTPFDLVVTDILMPDGDGVELIATLKKTRPAVRVLAISGGGRVLESNDCLRMAQGLGAHAAVLKPFTRNQFLAAVAQTLAAQPAPGSAAP